MLVDGASRVNDLGRATVLGSDLVLIPVQPSPFDVWAADDTVRLVQEAQQFKEGLGAAFAINRKIVNTAIGRDVARAFDDAPFPVLPAAVSQRVIFAESAGQGLWVGEVAPAGEAAREVAALGAALTASETRAAA
jgi:chromosome partitioning protein